MTDAGQTFAAWWRENYWEGDRFIEAQCRDAYAAGERAGAAVDAQARADERAWIAALVAAAQEVDIHLAELEDAWSRGALSEHDGKGGTRSNRNADLRRRLTRALLAAEADRR